MRLHAILLTCGLILTVAAVARPAPAFAETPPIPLAPLASISAAEIAVPVNGSMECHARAAQPGINGTVPAGWTGVMLRQDSSPNIESALFKFGGMDCNSDARVEHLELGDAWVFEAQDVESTPAPGKPFDAALFQQVPVTPGVAYSVSGWMLSLCGGSDPVSFCPSNYYIAKMLGLDAGGGTNALANSVTWDENDQPHTVVKWINLRTAAIAQGPVMTVFARINSPFQWHGNHAYVDAVKLVRAPTASLSINVPVESHQSQYAIAWPGSLGPDIPAIPSGNYHLYYDIQYRLAGSVAWTDWITNTESTSATFVVPDPATNPHYVFRVRPRAEQPDGAGASPNHRFPGVWAEFRCGPPVPDPGLPAPGEPLRIGAQQRQATKALPLTRPTTTGRSSHNRPARRCSEQLRPWTGMRPQGKRSKCRRPVRRWHAARAPGAQGIINR